MVTASPATAPGAARVYWLRGCPYCAMPRLGLRGVRVRAEWVNIWEDQAAAAAVRAITGGDETVPTALVGTRGAGQPVGPPGDRGRGRRTARHPPGGGHLVDRPRGPMPG